MLPRMVLHGRLSVSATLFAAAFLVTAPQARADGGSRGIDWQPCGPDFPGVECGKLAVPLDYDHPRGDKIDIALARIPARSDRDKIGSLFLNPGGPGGSGVDLVQFGFGDFISSLVDGRFDIVGFDPRGVAASNPIQCFDTNDELNAFFADLPIFPYLPGQARPYFDTYKAYTQRCLARRQAIARHMSTADVARDLDRLRRAVGDRKLTYLGFSYGSFIGSTYANLFPNRIRALAIDGVLNPQLWARSLQILSDRKATQEVFEEFIRLCDEAGPECGLSGPDGALARYDALAASLLEKPFVFPDGFAYSYDFLITDTVGVLYSPEIWGGPFGFAAFLGSLADAIVGDPTATERARSAHDAIQRFWIESNPSRETYNNGLDAFFGNHCNDAQYPFTVLGHKAVSEFAERGSRFGPFWWWGTGIGCARWPVAEDRYAGPWRVRTSAPVLVVGNFFDGVTDYAGAVSTSEFLTNSRLLSYAGWGHTAFGRSQCTTDFIVQYLLTGALPPEGTVCPANPNPFLPEPTTAAGESLRSASSLAPRPYVGLPVMPGRR